MTDTKTNAPGLRWDADGGKICKSGDFGLTQDEIAVLEAQMTDLIAYSGGDFVVIERTEIPTSAGPPIRCVCGQAIVGEGYVVMRCRDELAVGMRTFCEACLRYELEHPPVF